MALDLRAHLVGDPPAQLDLAPHARRGFEFCRKGLLDALGRLARHDRRCGVLLEQGQRAMSSGDGAAALARTAATAGL